MEDEAMSAKKLKKIAVTIGFKADNTPIKKAFYGRSTAQAKSRAERWLESHGTPEKTQHPLDQLLIARQRVHRGHGKKPSIYYSPNKIKESILYSLLFSNITLKKLVTLSAEIL